MVVIMSESATPEELSMDYISCGDVEQEKELDAIDSRKVKSRRSSRASILDSASASVDGLDLLCGEGNYGRRGPRPSLHRTDSIRSVCCEPHTEADWNVLRIRNPYLNLANRRNAFSVVSSHSFDKFHDLGDDGSNAGSSNTGSLTSLLAVSFMRPRLSSKSKNPLVRLGVRRKNDAAMVHSQSEDLPGEVEKKFSKTTNRLDSHRSTFSEVSGLSTDSGIVFYGSYQELSQLSPTSDSSGDSGCSSMKQQSLDTDDAVQVPSVRRQYIRAGIYSNMVSRMAQIKAR